MSQEAHHQQVFFGFELTDTTRLAISALFFQIAEDNTQPNLSAEAAAVVSTLIDAAMDAFYYEIMQEVRAHPTAKRSADAGINTVSKGSHLVVKKMVNSLEPEELEIFAVCLDGMLLDLSGKTYLALPLPDTLVHDIEQSIYRIRNDADTQAYNRMIVSALCDLAELAAQFFYQKPTRMFKVRPFIRKSADLGILTVTKGAQFVIKQLFKKTHQGELIKFSHMLEQKLIYFQTE